MGGNEKGSANSHELNDERVGRLGAQYYKFLIHPNML